MSGAEAVGAGVAAAEDDHALAARVERRVVHDLVAGDNAVLLLEVRHREVHAREVAIRARRADARCVAPTARHTASKSLRSCSPVIVAADVRAGAELDALGLHLFETAIEQALLHLEVGNAVPQQAADAVVALEEDDVVPLARELLRRRKASRPGADDGDLLAGALRGRLGSDPALLEGVVDDRHLDLLDRDRQSSLMPSTHAASHGAGHSRPVNSGKLLVACRRSIASCQRSR